MGPRTVLDGYEKSRPHWIRSPARGLSLYRLSQSRPTIVVNEANKILNLEVCHLRCAKLIILQYIMCIYLHILVHAVEIAYR
jgi:hypothetical protein